VFRVTNGRSASTTTTPDSDPSGSEHRARVRSVGSASDDHGPTTTVQRCRRSPPWMTSSAPTVASVEGERLCPTLPSTDATDPLRLSSGSWFGTATAVHQRFRCRVRQRGYWHPAYAGAGALGERDRRTMGRNCPPELLDRILIINRRHLTAVLAKYMAHFNHHRPHRALHQAAPLRSLPPPASPFQLHLRRRDLLDGLIHEYAQVV
jgi:hypothetical protein